jgi:hypothetical protein
MTPHWHADINVSEEHTVEVFRVEENRTSIPVVGHVQDQRFNRNSVKTHSHVSLWLTNHKAINRSCRVSSAHPAVTIMVARARAAQVISWPRFRRVKSQLHAPYVFNSMCGLRKDLNPVPSTRGVQNLYNSHKHTPGCSLHRQPQRNAIVFGSRPAILSLFMFFSAPPANAGI